MLEVLLCIFIAVVGIQLIYYGLIFGRFPNRKTKTPKPKKIGVSVLICAKNEAENLKRLLPLLVKQNYDTFEIVLINDGSTDDSLIIMNDFKKNYDNIKVVDVKPVEKFWGNKKYALTLGIKAASHDFLLFTDADCQPMSSQWISYMSSHFTNKKSIVIGYGAYEKVKGSLLNLLIRFETFMTAVQYLSYANIGLPYMAVGRNLAYRKELFFEAKGFMNHMDVMSGDDDLFINQVATKDNVAICISENSFTTSEPKRSFKSWILQKRRHVSTASHYKFKHKFLLATFYSSQILFWILAIILGVSLFQWKIVIALIVLRFTVQYLSLYFAAKSLKETAIILWLPFLEIILINIQFFIFIKNLSSKPNHWK